MFWPIDKLNTDARSLFTGIKICPECIKNDKVPYIRRAHQLTGVCTCHIHGCKLMAYVGRNGHEMDFDLDNYKEVESNIKMESMSNSTTLYLPLVIQSLIIFSLSFSESVR